MLEIFEFLFWISDHVGKRLDQKDRVNFLNLWRHKLDKKQLHYTLHILSDISRSKGNQKVRFNQLIECSVINNFLEKSFLKSGGETTPRPFVKKSKLSISLDQQSEVS